MLITTRYRLGYSLLLDTVEGCRIILDTFEGCRIILDTVGGCRIILDTLGVEEGKGKGGKGGKTRYVG